MKAQSAVIEIIEHTDDPDPQFIIPNEVRINGIALYTPADETVTVHEIDVAAQDVVKVTLTLFARRVTIGHEPQPTS